MKKHQYEDELATTDSVIKSSWFTKIIIPVTAIVSFAIWPAPWSIIQGLLYVVWVAIVYALTVLALVNKHNGLLPDSFLFRILLPLGITYVALQSLVSIDSLWKALLGLVVLLAIPLTIFITSKGKYVGFGTVKTFAIVGLIVGLVNGLIILAIVAAGAIVYLQIVGRRELLVGWLIAITTIVVQLAAMAMHIQ